MEFRCNTHRQSSIPVVSMLRAYSHNTVEGLWSLIKNGIRGVYHNVSPEYLQMYLDEFTFRYNRRHDGNQQFRAILKRVAGRVVARFSSLWNASRL